MIRNTKHYNLQMIITVGFKVNNERVVQFRKWASGIVKDYTVKGWIMDDESLKMVVLCSHQNHLIACLNRFVYLSAGFIRR